MLKNPYAIAAFGGIVCAIGIALIGACLTYWTM